MATRRDDTCATTGRRFDTGGRPHLAVRTALWLSVFAAAVSPAAAQSTSATVTMAVTVAAQARLTLSSSSLLFPDADPETVPLVPAVSGPVSIFAKVRASESAAIVLTVQASDDLRSGVTLLPVSLLSWTGSGAGFLNGTVSKSSAQPVAAWTGSGLRTGTQNYLFSNSWSHPAGTYTVTLVYTLSTP